MSKLKDLGSTAKFKRRFLDIEIYKRGQSHAPRDVTLAEIRELAGILALRARKSLFQVID